MDFLKLKASFMVVILVLSIFTVYLIKESQVVYAAPPSGKVCCERTVSEQFCVYTDPSSCDPDYNQASTTCEQTSFCQPVCCIDALEGTC